jgi:3-isopropylmalate/(R)-2-methylmalate dehydratase small subunit
MSGAAGRLAIDTVDGTAVAIRGDDIDTDRIIPARFLRAVTFEGLEAHLFEDDRRAAAAGGERHPLDDPKFAGASVLVTGRNFGCGSSREHAPQAIRRSGIRAIIGESFAGIFFANATVLGVPCVSASREAVAELMDAVEATQDLRVAIDLAASVARVPGRSFPIALPGAVRRAFLEGTWDPTALLVERLDQVRLVAFRLPYMDGFTVERTVE